jgi:hypothetical protein
MKTDQDYRDERNRREMESQRLLTRAASLNAYQLAEMYDRLERERRISDGKAPSLRSVRLRGREIGIPAPVDEPMIAVYETFQPPSHVWRWTCAVVASGVLGIIVGYCSRV